MCDVRLPSSLTPLAFPLYTPPVEHLVLIDGHHLMYRAYWAIPRTMTTTNGEQVNAVFGVASMLLHILRMEQPDAVLFCFDAGEETFRHEENATYKEGRAETPDDFYVQIPRIIALIEAFGIRHVSHTRYEADDFLCTYARSGVDDGMRVTIVSGDKDILQLASPQVRIAIPHKGYQAAEYLDDAGVLAKYGIRPDQVASYKGLTGDASDNLPGVKGIGPKTAAQLLQRFDSLAGVYDHLDEISGTVRAKLEHDREQAFFCERMAQLICDIPLPVPLKETRLQALPTDAILAAFRDCEFTLLSRRLHDLVATPYGQRVFQPATAGSAPMKTSNDSQLSMF